MKVARWPEASHTFGLVRIAASIGTMSSRCWTIARHQASLTLRSISEPSGPVVVGGAQSAVDLGRREDEAAALGEVDDGVEARQDQAAARLEKWIMVRHQPSDTVHFSSLFPVTPTRSPQTTWWRRVRRRRSRWRSIASVTSRSSSSTAEATRLGDGASESPEEICLARATTSGLTARPRRQPRRTAALGCVEGDERTGVATGGARLDSDPHPFDRKQPEAERRRAPPVPRSCRACAALRRGA